jgi:hypothetical protein
MLLIVIIIVVCMGVGVLYNVVVEMERTITTMEDVGMDSYSLDLHNNLVNIPQHVIPTF